MAIAIDHAKINVKPTFTNVEDERQHRKERLAAAFRVFAKLGYEEGVMGHISVRDPEWTDHYWTNPFGLSFGLIKASDLVLTSPDAKIVAGHGLVHPGGIQLHLPILRDNPHIISAAHTLHLRAHLVDVRPAAGPVDSGSSRFLQVPCDLRQFRARPDHLARSGDRRAVRRHRVPHGRRRGRVVRRFGLDWRFRERFMEPPLFSSFSLSGT